MRLTSHTPEAKNTQGLSAFLHFLSALWRRPEVLGYIQQSPEEAEVLFTLLAERYERRSVILTSNLVFGEWDRIFRDQMATAAAIDRLVHHSAILEFDVLSHRAEEAQRRGKKRASHQVEATA